MSDSTRKHSDGTRKHLAYNFLKRAILDGRYPPGQIVLEETVAGKLKISRTPVREAIRELSREGLIETRPNRRARVRILNSDDLLEIFDIKIRLEGLCAARAAERSNKTTVRELEVALEAMTAASKTRDRHAYLTADEAFHSAIYAGAKGERTHQIINYLNSQWHRLRQGMTTIESRMATSLEEHRRIAEAIGEGEPSAAEAAMMVHLENLRDEIRTALELIIASGTMT